MDKKEDELKIQSKKSLREKLFSIEDPKEFALEVMSKNNFKTHDELTQFIKKLPYCLAPWLHSHLNPAGERKLCCVAKPSGIDYSQPFSEYWNSDYLQNVRSKMIAHDPPIECSTCINHVGPRSQRSIYYHLLFHLPKMSEIKWSEKTNFQPVSIDYRANRNCNYTCRMCSAAASSSIEKLEVSAQAVSIQNPITENVLNNLKNEIIEILSHGQLVDINFADGEPFISTLHWEIIDFLVTNNMSKNVILRYTSNLSTLHYKGLFIPDYLKEHFSKVFISMSLDGIEETAEFVRDGLKWSKWYKNYQIIKESLGDKSVRFNITVSIPVLLDLERLSKFLDFEDLDFSIDSSHPHGNELLLSPHTLDKDSLTEIVIKRLLTIKNIRVRSYLENLLKNYSPEAFYELQRNFENIRVYYFKIDSNKNRIGTMDYLAEHKELKLWWQLVRPHARQTLPSARSTFAIKVSRLMPKEIGRIVYSYYFNIYKILVWIKVGRNAKLWTRNSLNQSFFKFGESDIDVTVSLKKNEDYFLSNSKINKVLNENFLIKEVNVYCPFSLAIAPVIMNTFELKRDLHLLKIVVSDSRVKDLKAEAFVFLLRMLFANKKIYSEGLSGRGIEKWKYYFNISDCPDLSEKLIGSISYGLLLEMILVKFSLDPEIFSEAIEKVYIYLDNKIPIYMLYAGLKNKGEVLSLFPHLFCHLEIEPIKTTPFLENIFIAQISWELMSTLSQGNSVEENSKRITHLSYLNRYLEKTNFNHWENNNIKNALIKSIHLSSKFLENVC